MKGLTLLFSLMAVAASSRLPGLLTKVPQVAGEDCEEGYSGERGRSPVKGPTPGAGEVFRTEAELKAGLANDVGNKASGVRQEDSKSDYDDKNTKRSNDSDQYSDSNKGGGNDTDDEPKKTDADRRGGHRSEDSHSKDSKYAEDNRSSKDYLDRERIRENPDGTKEKEYLIKKSDDESRQKSFENSEKGKSLRYDRD